MNNAPTIQRVLFRRTGALGDVLCTTPAIRAMRQLIGPDGLIDVETDYPHLFNENPHITEARKRDSRSADVDAYDRIIDLNLAYERRPRMHIIDAYLLEAFDRGRDFDAHDKRIVFQFSKDTDCKFGSSADLANSVVIHASVTWRNRTMTPAFWADFTFRMLERGYRVIVVGGRHDLSPSGSRNVQDLVDKGVPLTQVAAIINRCACFVTPDSGLLHLAGATDAPIVALFSCARAEYRLPFRGGILGQDIVSVVPALDCYGCLADIEPPATYCDCRRHDFACVTGMDPERVARAVDQAMAQAQLRKGTS